MGSIYCASFKIAAMQSRLNDDVLFGVYGAADFVPFAGWYSKLITQTAQLQAVLETGGGAVIAGSQNMLIPHRHRPDMVTTAG
jgi:hypothetical protein